MEVKFDFSLCYHFSTLLCEKIALISKQFAEFSVET